LAIDAALALQVDHVDIETQRLCGARTIEAYPDEQISLGTDIPGGEVATYGCPICRSLRTLCGVA
jgi:hypothetical protein